jgi:beta-barrel assembly-enhancing protease
MRIFLLGALLLLTQSRNINFFSLSQDIEIGSVSSKEAEKTLPLVRDSNLNLHLRGIGQRLIRNAALPSLQYQFRIVNSKDINSLGFPGGAIYVNRGLIELAVNDDELAAILAHEIGHVASRHGTAQLSRQLLVQSPISIAGGLPMMDVWREQLTKLGVSFGLNASFLRYSRDQEIEAGLMAVRLLADAKRDHNALRTVLEKISEIQNAEGGRSPAFVFNHPQAETLAPEIVEEIERLRVLQQRTARPTPGFRAFYAALLRLPYPTEKDAHESPSNDATWNVFTHPKDFFRLGYPPEWQITRTGPDGAIAAPSDGVQTSRAGDDVTHGVMFDLFDISDRPLTLEQATNRLIILLRQNNQSLRIVPGAQAQILVSDEPGMRTVLIGQSRSTNSSEVVWVVTRVYYQSLFYMVFVAPEDEFPMYQPIFEQIIRSARVR